MSGTMRGAVLDYDTHTVKVKDVPIPQPGPGEVRITVKAAGVCLSDVHLATGQIKPIFSSERTVILGHEVSGVVDQLGSEVEGWAPGDRVTLFPITDKVDGPRT